MMKGTNRALVYLLAFLMALPLNTAFAAETITYFHNDAVGSPMVATDASGNLLWKESYQPYGGKLNNQPASASNKIGYAGKPFDNTTGLSYMGARYYDPVLGRFTGIDPVGFQEDNLHSFNRYTYANNNPYKFVDPDGRFAVILAPVLLLAGLLGAAIAVNSGRSAGQSELEGGSETSDPTSISSMPGTSGGWTLPSWMSSQGADDKGGADKGGGEGDTTKETIEREKAGKDGGKSQQVIERDKNGDVISRTHQVTKDGEVVHQHQNHIGKEGGERQFPDEWTGTKTINAPYENYPPRR